MKVLYFDCFNGAAGDMILGALVDAGLPIDALQAALGSLAVAGCEVSADRVVKHGLTAVKFRVHEPVPAGAAGDERAAHGHHHLRDIRAAIGRSNLSDTGQARANRLFTRLAEAEAAIHGSTLEQVHLHEVGALDSIVDIVGAVFALEWFAADRVVVSPMNVGGGMVRSAHGVFPVPAPATLRVLGSAPVYSSGVPFELLTPTGALILTEYATSYGPMPSLRIDRVGYGAGDRDLPETPNVLRVVAGTMSDEAPAMRVAVVACEIDDMNPQIFGALMDRLYAGGALEVFYQPVQMKKNRPGTLMTMVCRPQDRRALTDLVFAETTTIGVRHHEMDRECLDRETVTVATPWGEVRIKVARQAGRVLNAQPEFDDVARLASAHAVPIKDVHAQAQRAWLDSQI
jgi:uncharacterized protein (TIGR00299 family) protein